MTDSPCDHSDAWVGRIQGGDLRSAPHCSVYTCLRCVDASREYVTGVTSLAASDLILFERYLA
ncbi:hypothetical protein [Nocardia brasiliensis]|uniref:hypothetical protein n=1 Tax=Nocardia brasiliensis TaxID=37326 RepID=UPI0024546BDB|nr:hypothetical protein [Nocardia brasiliensis]